MDQHPEGVVLLAAPPGADAAFDRDALERMGHPVLTCPGPPASQRCPLLRGAGCTKFGRAHGIVFKLDLGRPQHREILRRYRELARADVPIRALVSATDAERYPDLLADVETWVHEPDVADLDGFAAEVEAADRLA